VLNKANRLQPIETPNLNDAVYRVLRDWICTANLAPGQRINLTELEEQLQVSRTPIKMALKQLELEGFVKIEARRGTFVAPIDADVLEGNFKIRSAFELYVALCLFKYLDDDDYMFLDDIQSEMEELIADSDIDERLKVVKYLELDRKFHEYLVQCGGPDRMMQLYQQNDTHSYVLRMSKDYTFNDLQASHREHLKIFAAIMEQSPESLSMYLLDHLESERHWALGLLET